MHLCDNIGMRHFMISIKNLYLSFTKEYDALHNINLEIEDGEKVAFVGEKDSGKTMLLRVIAKLEKFKSGEIYIKGINLKKINFKQDVQVGFVPKNFVFLKNKTVRENLEYMLKMRKYDSATINLKILMALRGFEIEDIQNLKIRDLSPYQKTLVELARVSLRKVELFLIDDICNGLDAEETEKIMKKLKDLIEANQFATFVFAFTNKAFAEYLNLRIVELNDGKIIKND